MLDSRAIKSNIGDGGKYRSARATRTERRSKEKIRREYFTLHEIIYNYANNI